MTRGSSQLVIAALVAPLALNAVLLPWFDFILAEHVPAALGQDPLRRLRYGLAQNGGLLQEEKGDSGRALPATGSSLSLATRIPGPDGSLTMALAAAGGARHARRSSSGGSVRARPATPVRRPRLLAAPPYRLLASLLRDPPVQLRQTGPRLLLRHAAREVRLCRR
ncbi:hypothetical protein ABZ723_10020 [Streptomyces sp. NPDC006700]|uniref:hypothetical protein n=1 Tax=unclassified Streptomyces TaxID=2593676 RepID=UPI003409C392